MCSLYWVWNKKGIDNYIKTKNQSTIVTETYGHSTKTFSHTNQRVPLLHRILGLCDSSKCHIHPMIDLWTTNHNPTTQGTGGEWTQLPNEKYPIGWSGRAYKLCNKLFYEPPQHDLGIFTTVRHPIAWFIRMLYPGTMKDSNSRSIRMPP